MNLFLQIGIGLGVVTLVVWLCLFLQKRKRWWKFAYAGIVTTACIAALVCGLLKKAPEEETTITPLTQQEWITFAYSFAVSDAYGEAFSLLEEYGELYGYDEECSLLTARLYALQGKYEEASGIYQSLTQTEDYSAIVAEEYDYVAQKNESATDEAAMIRFLRKNGKDPLEYGYDADTIARAESKTVITQEMISTTIVEAMLEEYDTEDFEKEVSYVLQAKEFYDTYAAYGTDSLDESEVEEIEAVRKSLTKLKKKGEGTALVSCVRDSLLGLNLLLGDYEAIAENVDSFATYTELVIASELYMGGIIREKDFTEAYVASYKGEAERVGEQLRVVYAAESGDLEDEVAEELERIVKSWKSGLKYPALTSMKNALETIASEGEANAETSKVYLALAKIEHFYENEKERSGNITEAVNTGQDSEDMAYSSAMGKLYDIIHSNEITSEIMQVPDYVEEILEHAMPMELYELFPSHEEGLQLYSMVGEDPIWMGSEYEEEEEEEEDLVEEVKKEFSQVFVEYVSEVRSSIGIGYIDTTEFSTVKARVTISSEYATNSKELSKILSVYDCGLEISDFTIEKVTHDSVRTYLICDVSGSMDDSIYDLREAVITYINGKGKEEQIALSTFSSYLEGTVPFGSEDSELIAFAESMYASGGTAIYNTLIQIMQSLDTTQNSNNVIILMTDGEDGYRASYQTIETELRRLAEDKNITVYTLGLGYVDTEYLSAIAESGRGSFVYVSDSTSLDNFYQLLHSQVDNQYILTYDAVDTLTGTNRTLEVKISKDNVSDVKTYSILEDVENIDGSEEGLTPARVMVNNLGVRLVYKGMQETQNTVLGEGFVPESRAVIRLLGENNYTMELTYVDENTYRFTMPADVEIGNYDAEVSVDGKKAILQNAVCVLDPTTEAFVTFGPYVFTASKLVNNNDGSVTLSGNVMLNDWLHFKGNIKIKGNWETDTTIRVVDSYGSYVKFDPDGAKGLGKYFAEKGFIMDVPILHEFELYYDSDHLYDSDEYRVEEIRLPLLRIIQVVKFDSPFIKLYPDRIELRYENAEPHFPFQDLIFRSDKEEFEVECKGSALLNQENFGILIEVGGEGGGKNYRQFNMFNAPVYLSMDELEVKIDTFNHQYALGAMVDIGFLDFGIGARAEFKGFTPDQFTLTVDKDVNTTMGGIPLTFSNFKLGAEDLADALEQRSFSKLKIVGGFDLAAAKVSAFFPNLEKFVGDVSVLAMKDTTVELDLDPLSFKAEAKLTFLEQIQLLQAGLTIGTFEYSNEMLEMDSVLVSGLMATLGAGINWDIKDCKVNIFATGELDALNRFFGVQLKSAIVEVDIKWWLFKKHIEKEAKALLGLYFTEANEPQFMLILSTEGKKREKTILYIDKNGKTGKADNMNKIK